MGRARLSTHRERELELVRFTPLGEYVLVGEGEVVLVEPSDGEWVEIRCDACGRWTREAYPRPGAQGRGRPHRSRSEGALWRCLACVQA